MSFLKKDSVSYLINNRTDSTKLALFDLDHTLVRPKSGNTFAIDANDWTYHFLSVKNLLQQFTKDGYKIVIFTNQLGVSKGKIKLNDLHDKFYQIMSDLQISLDVFIATDEDYYRKPLTGMWNLFLTSYPDTQFDHQNSFYCGDAAGRPKNWKTGVAKDFSSSDLYFAHNINLTFRFPEDIFGELEDSKLCSTLKLNNCYQSEPTLQWKQYLKPKPPIFLNNSTEHPELVIMIGPAASGKSTYTAQYLKHGYIHVNQDLLKNKNNCIKIAKTAIESGKSLIIDNTNPDVATRKLYFDLVKSSNKSGKYIVTAIHMTTPIPVCQHLNYYRVQKSQGKIRRIPQVAYNMFKSKFIEPSKEEGFHNIIKTNFHLDKEAIEEPEFNFYYDF